uniref:Transcription initiation factor IIF subunit alpha n=1 Tax=Macrostomum lignano TaxID=282301 RepID=A0A1I8JHF6_9PLAT
MPFGCFGKRKKQDRADKPNDKAANDGEVKSDGVAKPTEDSGAEVNEVIAVARAHSLHASAPNSVEHRHTTIGIQKSATLARYDFLRKSDYTNTADRWVALKQQYLAQHAGQNGSAGGTTTDSGSKMKRTAMSLPRQFSPPNSANTVVRFSHWFYERQTMEADARREFHEREEKTRKLLDGVAEPDSRIPEETTTKIDSADNDGVEQPESKAGDAVTSSAPPTDEEPIDIDLTDPDVQAAAAKIQKGWGNRRAAAAAKSQPEPKPIAAEAVKAAEQEEVVDIDLNDPEVQAAAAKIQKGWGTRKLAAKQKASQEPEAVQINKEDAPETAAASALGDNGPPSISEEPHEQKAEENSNIEPSAVSEHQNSIGQESESSYKRPQDEEAKDVKDAEQANEDKVENNTEHLSTRDGQEDATPDTVEY